MNPYKISPLYGLAQNYLYNSNEYISPETNERAMEIFDQLLKYKITPEKAKVQLSYLNINMAAYDKIVEILNTPNQPIIPKTGMKITGCDIKKKKQNNWSKYEDQRLLMGIHIYGLDNWAMIAKYIGNNRTRAQCSQRWNRGLNPSIKKTHWSEAEEELLLNLVEQYGTKSWTKVAEKMENRCDVQCRYHYIQMVKENRRFLLNKEVPKNSTIDLTPNLFEESTNENTIFFNTPTKCDEVKNDKKELEPNQFIKEFDEFWNNFQIPNEINEIFELQESNELDF